MIEKLNAKALVKLRAEEAERASWLPLKELAIQMYSDCRGTCAGCAQNHVEELFVARSEEPRLPTAFHYFSGGYDRKLTAKLPLYRWLKDQGYPRGYTVFCVRCFNAVMRLHVVGRPK